MSQLMQNQHSQSLITIINCDFSSITRVPLPLSTENLQLACRQLYRCELPCEYSIHDPNGKPLNETVLQSSTPMIPAIQLKLHSKNNNVHASSAKTSQLDSHAEMCRWCSQFHGHPDTNRLCSVCYRFSTHEGHAAYDPHAQQAKYQLENEKRCQWVQDQVNRLVLSETEFRALYCHLRQLRFHTVPLTPIEFVTRVHQMMHHFVQQCSGAREECWISARQALELYEYLKMPCENWRMEHVLCSRVVDRWNIDEDRMKLGHCYYYQAMPQLNQKVELPKFNQAATMERLSEGKK